MISVKDSSGQENRTSLDLEVVPLKTLDCDFIVEDLCFWKSVQYRIYENTKASFIGSLGAAYLVELCPKYQITYRLVSKNANFKLSDHEKTGVYTTKPLDRDRGDDGQSFEVLCTVENPQRNVRNVTKKLEVVIMDVDDNPPEAQEDVINISLEGNVVRKVIFFQHLTVSFFPSFPVLSRDTVNKTNICFE